MVRRSVEGQFGHIAAGQVSHGEGQDGHIAASQVGHVAAGQDIHGEDQDDHIAFGQVSHIGASLLVFGLITFFLAAAWFEMRVVSIVIAVLVGVLYGGSLLWGVVPMQRGVSWDGHLCGAIAGIIVAFLQSRLTSRSISKTASV